MNERVNGHVNVNENANVNVNVNENVSVNVNVNVNVDEHVSVNNNAIIPRCPASLHEFVINMSVRSTRYVRECLASLIVWGHSPE